MTSRVLLFPWKMTSNSGKYLAQALGLRRIYPDRNYKPRKGDVILNWGNSQKPVWWQALVDKPGTTIINSPDRVKVATNKLLAFQAMSAAGVRVPEFTDDPYVAFNWCDNDGPVCARTILNGHSAAGLIIVTECEDMGEFPMANLYTRYVKKKDEYRVHVFSGNIIDVTKKRLRNGLKDSSNYKVRNYRGGWVYTRENIDPPADVINQAQLAVSALGLGFGAVDIGWNEHHQQASVYEVNSAPGLVGTTLYRYAAALKATFPFLSLNMEEPEQDFDGFDDFDQSEFDADPAIAQTPPNF